MTKKEQQFLRHIQYCVRHIHTPDLHSFTARVPGGVAFVEAQYNGAVWVDVNTGNCEHRFFTGAPTETAEFLASIGADPSTIET